MQVVVTQCDMCGIIRPTNEYGTAELGEIMVPLALPVLGQNITVLGGGQQLTLSGVGIKDWVSMDSVTAMNGIDVCPDCFRILIRAILQGIPEKLRNIVETPRK